MENFNNDDRKFKGIWIPSEIWLNKDLHQLEKILLSEIISLDKGPGCRASNKYFADFLQTTDKTVSRYINNLKKLKLIDEISFDGRKRYLKSCPEKIFTWTNCLGSIDNLSRQHRQNVIGCLDNNGSDIDNTIDNIKDILKNNKKKFLSELKKLGLCEIKTKKDKKYNEDSIQYKLAEFLYREIESQDPFFTEPNLNKWSNTINLIIYSDKKDPNEIKKIISWAVRDKFHQNLLINPIYLRNKYETLRKQCYNSYNNSNKKETYIGKLIKENKF